MTYDQETLKALRASIEHWEENTAASTARDINTGPEACALCEKFNFPGAQCEGCPVQEATGYPFCRTTPYTYAENALYPGCKNLSSFKRAAQAEVEFLQALWPAGAEVER